MVSLVVLSTDYDGVSTFFIKEYRNMWKELLLISYGKYISTMFFQIELPRDSMIVGRNRGHVTSRAKRVKYKAEVEAILSLSRGVIHLKEHS